MLRSVLVRRSVAIPSSPRRFFASAPAGDKFVVHKDGKVDVEFTSKNPFTTYNCEGPELKVSTTKDEMVGFFRQMSVMRRMEVVADNMYKQRQIRGFLHLYNGQEAIVAGTESAINRNDHVITAYRCHAHYLGRGGTLQEMFAELLGKKTGCAEGKGGSMHMYHPEGFFHGGNGIVGAQVPVGAGLALAAQYLGTGQIALTFYGDGAANQGQVFEAFNMAALWKLPCLFICENNGYGMGTSAERASAETRYYQRGQYIPGLKIDAMNVLAVKAGMQWAAAWAREGKGPLVLEMETYRYMGHSMSDPGLSYRTRDEVAQIKAERDPIDRVKRFILDNGIGSEEQLKDIEKEVRKEVDAAVKEVREHPDPELSDLYTHVVTDYPYYARAVELPDSRIVQ